MAPPDQQASAESKTPTQRDASTAAFEFVRDLSAELSASKIELPSYPEVASQVQKVLSEENCSSERVVRVMGAEPVLATRVLTMANSAALNPGATTTAPSRATPVEPFAVSLRKNAPSVTPGMALSCAFK